jgi:hypothetical protein
MLGPGESGHRRLTAVGASRWRFRNTRARARLVFNLDGIGICPLIGADQKWRIVAVEGIVSPMSASKSRPVIKGLDTDAVVTLSGQKDEADKIAEGVDRAMILVVKPPRERPMA